MYSVFLDDKNIFLGPLSKEDNLENYTNWLNDQETTLFMGSGRFPVSVDGLKNYIDRYNNSEEGMLLGIFLKKARKHIGIIRTNNTFKYLQHHYFMNILVKHQWQATGTNACFAQSIKWYSENLRYLHRS